MCDTTNAEKHAMIASEVYKVPLTEDFNYVHRAFVETDGTCRIDMDHPFDEPFLFDLLETEAGEPTRQAKASALDVLEWILRERPHLNLHNDFHESTTEYDGWQVRSRGGSASVGIGAIMFPSGATACAAIYEAAKSIVAYASA